MASKEEFLVAQFGGNPFDELGLQPDFVKQIEATGGPDALKLVAKGLQRAVATSTHPDKTGTEAPAVFYQTADAAKTINDLPAEQVREYAQAFVLKGNKKRLPPKDQRVAYIDNPQLTDTLARLGEGIKVGELKADQLKKPLRLVVKQFSDNSTSAIFHHTPGSELVLQAVGEIEEPTDQFKSACEELFEAIWWRKVPADETTESDRREGKAIRLTGLARRVNIIVDNDGLMSVYEDTTGDLVHAGPSPDDIDGEFSMTNYTRSETTDGQTDTKIYNSVNNHRTSAPNNSQPTRLVLLGSIDEVFINEAKTEIAKNLQPAKSNVMPGLSKPRGALIFQDQANSYARFFGTAVDHVLNNDPIALAKHFVPVIRQESFVVVLDSETNQLKVLGTALSLQNPAS